MTELILMRTGKDNMQKWPGKEQENRRMYVAQYIHKTNIFILKDKFIKPATTKHVSPIMTFLSRNSV